MSAFPPVRGRSRRTRPVTPGAAKSRMPRHRLDPDESISPDFFGRQTCRSCHMAGKAGDVHHLANDEPDQVYPEQDPETRQLELRRLGEREDD